MLYWYHRKYKDKHHICIIITCASYSQEYVVIEPYQVESPIGRVPKSKILWIFSCLTE